MARPDYHAGNALPDRWPRPASHPPKPDANGVVEGEALQIIGLTAGSVEIQDFANLSKKFQLWVARREGR